MLAELGYSVAIYTDCLLGSTWPITGSLCTRNADLQWHLLSQAKYGVRYLLPLLFSRADELLAIMCGLFLPDHQNQQGGITGAARDSEGMAQISRNLAR